MKPYWIVCWPNVCILILIIKSIERACQHQSRLKSFYPLPQTYLIEPCFRMYLLSSIGTVAIIYSYHLFGEFLIFLCLNNLKNCFCYYTLRINWLINGVLELNPKLDGHPKINEVALTAITRIDFSHNNLINVPSEIFNLVSLKWVEAKAECRTININCITNCFLDI